MLVQNNADENYISLSMIYDNCEYHSLAATAITAAATTDKPCKSKVGNFDHRVFSNQAVTSSEVAVYKL